MDSNVLRLVWDSDFSAALGQGIIWDAYLLVPLHVLDESFHLAQQNLVLYQVSGKRDVVRRLRLIRRFPSADAATFSLDCDLSVKYSLSFAKRAREGEKVIVQWLSFRKGIIDLETVTSKIRAIVKIDRYEYLSAAAAKVRTRDISAIFLDKKMPLGASGAPVYRPGSGKILGFVHGNAAVNGSLGICLDPHALWADCMSEHESSASLQLTRVY